MNSNNIRIGIIAHIDQTERKTPLPEDKRKADILRKIFRWSKIEHEGYLWEDFKFFKHVANMEDEVFNVWEMPILAGIHVESVIRKIGGNFETMRINSISDDSKEAEYARLKEFDPDCIFLSTTFILNKEQLNNTIKNVRSEFPVTPIILGGNFVVKEIAYGFDINQMLKVCGDNVYIINSKYAEVEILDLLNSILKKDGKTTINAEGNIIKDRSNEHKYDIDKWRADYIALNYNSRLAPVRTAAGCPFACTFCSYPGSAGAYLQEDISTTLVQLRALKAQGVKQIIFTDDTFNVPLQRFTALLKQMVAEGLTTFQCFSFCRCQYLNEETAALMKQCGFQAVLLGIESGSRSMLDHMNKKAKPEEYRRGIGLLKQNGITTFSAIIIGHPGETRETIQETVEFLNTSGLDYCYIQPFYYLHNSPIHLKAKEYDLKGEGLNWTHQTMNSIQCMNILDELIFQIKGPTYANEEYAMWEMIHFMFKGYSKEFYHEYRIFLNNLRKLHLSKDPAAQDKHNQLIQEFRNRHNFNLVGQSA
jgi:radical SAM superfamily enzyme YgiQ (UPF0313 family)